MEHFSNEEKFDIMCTYARCHRNAVLRAQTYFEQYSERPQPGRKYFKLMERNLKEDGCFMKSRKRTRTVTNSEEGVVNVLAYVEQKNLSNEDTSLREIELNCGVKKDSASSFVSYYL